MDGVVVIGCHALETSRGPLEAGARQRLPLVEAVQLQQAGHVTLADWREQQAPEPAPSVRAKVLEAVTEAVETVTEAVTRKRRRYRRRDLQADQS